MNREYSFVDDNGNAYPEWEVKKLGTMTSIDTGKKDANAMVEKGDYKFFTCSRDIYHIDTYSWDCEAILMAGNGNIGEPKYYKGKFDAYQRTYILHDFKGIEPLYLMPVIDAIFPKVVARETQTGSMPYIKLGTLTDFLVPTPSIPEQKKIADFFSTLDERINLTAEKVKLLKEQKQGYLQRVFSGDMAFTDDNGNPYPAWKKKKLKEIAQILRGQGLNKASLTKDGENLCVLYGQLFSLYGNKITDVVSSTNEKTNVFSKAGDILMPTSDVTPSGLATASCILLDRVLLGSDMNIIRPDSTVYPLFLSYQIQFDKKKIIDKVSGTTVKHIYAKDLYDLEYQFPSIPEQQKIAEFFSALDEQIELNENKLALLKEQKKGYLQGIFG